MSENFNVQWLNQNTLRAYPLRFDCSTTDITGSFKIPHSLIADMSIYGSPSTVATLIDDTSTPIVYISDITMTTTSISIAFARQASVLIPAGPCGYVNIPRTAADYTTVPIVVTSRAGLQAYAGNLTIGTLADIAPSDVGTFRFLPAATTVEFCCVHFDVGRNRSLVVYQSGKPLQYVEGNVRLTAGQNIRFVGGRSGVGISAAYIDSLQPVCDPNRDYWRFSTPVKTINGVPPSPVDGGFLLANDPCTEIAPLTGQSGLSIANKCGVPCCSNENMNKLTSEVEDVVASFTALETLVNTLEKSLKQFETSVIASRSD